MNKVNLCWVFSDGRKGHDIQSLTLANAVSHEVREHPFKLSQPWLAWAPRLMPWMAHGLDWCTTAPDVLNGKPDLIITTGRRGAAVGRYLKQQLNGQNHLCKHLQILNPQGNTGHYDLLLTPEHDRITGPNVVPFRGSLHPFTTDWHQRQEVTSGYQPYLALLLGNPGLRYWQQDFPTELATIRSAFPNEPLYLCGSPRLSTQVGTLIRQSLGDQDKAWLSEADGENPYQKLLCNAKKLFVTADSINMVNECLAAPRPTSLLASTWHKTNRHRKFTASVSAHCVPLGSMHRQPAPVDSIRQVLDHPLLRDLLKQQAQKKQP